MQTPAQIDRMVDRKQRNELNRYLDQEAKEDMRQEAINDLMNYKTEEALNDETVFNTLDQNYEVIDKGQVMRALRSLDNAVHRFNMLHNITVLAAMNDKDKETAMQARVDIDAVFTALSNIQKNFDSAIQHEAESEYPECNDD